ncbi:transposase [Romboutsia sp.]|uniref:transposase n=1 Tax=Romboutsia sp. TaxID=1965302 RepID=UPI003F32577B
MNPSACNECINRIKCTNSKSGRSITRDEHSYTIDDMVYRINRDKTKYAQKKSIVEHPFGTLKRSMNFTYLLLRNSEKVKGEVSLTFFAYNLKRVINILGVKEIIASLCSILYKLKIELDYIFCNLAQNYNIKS